MSDFFNSEQEQLLPRLWRADEINPPEQTAWIAKNRLPRGHISMLVGDEGIGKSLFWVWLSAFITTGKPFEPFGIPERKPLDVVLVTTEDDAASEIKPRLDIAGCDFERVHWFAFDKAATDSPTFPAHIDVLASELNKIEDKGREIGLIILDAWVDTLPSGLQLKDPAKARLALNPWKKIAKSFNTAVLIISHTNRLNSKNSRDNYGLTGELRKKVRMALFAQQDDDGALLIGPEKSNSTKLVAASRFEIEAVQYWPQTVDDDGTKPKLIYLGGSDKTARQLVAEKAEFALDSTDYETLSDIQAWLKDYLTEKPGTNKRDVEKAARAQGFAERSLRRAFNKIKGVSKREGFPAVAVWYPPYWDEEPESVNSYSQANPYSQATENNKSGLTDKTLFDYGKQEEKNTVRPVRPDIRENDPTNRPSINDWPNCPNLSQLQLTRANANNQSGLTGGLTEEAGLTDSASCFDCKKPISKERRRCKECTTKLAEKEGRA